MDTWLAIASRREVRRYADTELPADVVERILDAGRLAGNASNRQPWRFLVVESAELREKVAEQVYEEDNIRGAKLVVALSVSGKGPTSFDAGRAAQNMMLAAWNDGVGSCPNGLPDAEATGRLLGLGEGERLVIVLSFGYPAKPRDPESRTRGGVEPPGEAKAARRDRHPVVDRHRARAARDPASATIPCAPAAETRSTSMSSSSSRCEGGTAESSVASKTWTNSVE